MGYGPHLYGPWDCSSCLLNEWFQYHQTTNLISDSHMGYDLHMYGPWDCSYLWNEWFKKNFFFVSAALGLHCSTHASLVVVHEPYSAWAQLLRHLGLVVACEILGPQPGNEPGPPALGAWSFIHWTTREVPPGPIFWLMPGLGDNLTLNQALRRGAGIRKEIDH